MSNKKIKPKSLFISNVKILFKNKRKKWKKNVFMIIKTAAHALKTTSVVAIMTTIWPVIFYAILTTQKWSKKHAPPTKKSAVILKN